MRPGYQKLLLLITGLSFFAVSYFLFFPANNESKFNSFEKYEDESSKARFEINKERWKYYFDMLRDPATNKIPPQIRQRELKFAKQLSATNRSLKKSISTNITWKEAGPVDVGGRTRALAVDLKNPNIVIAGGVSGGIWKSTDNGSSWSLKSTTNQLLSITAIAQDPRDGQTNTWYASGGEFDGSAQDLGYTAFFTGDGIYKSSDNGDTWNLLPNTSDQNAANFNQFSYSSRIVINPKTGSVFITNNGFGVLRSNDGGASFTQVLGGPGHHIYSDIAVASNGTLVAALSIPFNNVTPTENAGVYKSTDDGANWTNITPNDYPATPQRSGIAIAPSNPDKFYILTNTGTVDADKKNVLKFYKATISSGSFEDRSANLPDFTSQGNGYEKGFIDLQGNYNLTVAVKPDDENFVLLAGTCLFRSSNGFSSKPNDAVKDWIGGYNPSTFFYPNFHPDIHSFAFDPTNPQKMWWGNDGGLAYTTDITNTSFTSLFPWENKNNGYNVTQYYTIGISKDSNDNRIMGGCQDNGTPFFRFDGSTTTPHVDVSLGDGTFSYLASNFAYAETQNGNLLRLHYDQSGNIPGLFDNNNYSTITPSNAANQTFVNPFTVDPVDEDVMYYLAGPDIWRNNQLSSIPDGVYKTDVGWTKLDNLSAAQGLTKTTIAVSTSPAHILYFAESGDNTTKPKIFKLQNANTSTSNAVDISIPDAVAGAYVQNIAINPDDANEIIVVMSNYNIVGLYHSTDGGQSYTAIEGNLVGTEQNPGPSLRAASILPGSPKTYFVATSIGVFSTTQINAGNTSWVQEGQSIMGNVVVDYVVSRKSDGRVVAGTHGRGAFVANVNTVGTAIASTNVSSLTLRSGPGESGSTSFVLNNEGGAQLNFDISVSGNFGKVKFVPSNYQNKEAYKLNSFKIKHKLDVKRLKNNTNIHSESEKSFNNIPIPQNIKGNDVILLDDGNESADDFIGYGDGTDVDWVNEFDVSGYSFVLDEIKFYMRTEQADHNYIEAFIYDDSSNVIFTQSFSMPLSASGAWYSIPVNPTLSFNDGDKFFIEILSFSSIPAPAGVDLDALVKNKSFYFNRSTFSYENLNTLAGYENGAFLIRAVGTAATGGGNQNPIAVATVSKNNAQVNESITFDASQSNDGDGQVTQYLWNFGDGSTSTQQLATHSYSQPNNYTYTLKVTDNQGGTGQATGQIIVTGTSNHLVTVNPASGTIAPGGSQIITLTLDAQTLNSGTFTGQVNISTNGGNITIPIDYLVDVEKNSYIAKGFNLGQNYPNPFNPATTIEYTIPSVGHSLPVQLNVYDVLGNEIAILVKQQQNPGNYKVNFDASNLSSGIYFYRLNAGEFTQDRKMLFLK